MGEARFGGAKKATAFVRIEVEGGDSFEFNFDDLTVADLDSSDGPVNFPDEVPSGNLTLKLSGKSLNARLPRG